MNGPISILMLVIAGLVLASCGSQDEAPNAPKSSTSLSSPVQDENFAVVAASAKAPVTTQVAATVEKPAAPADAKPTFNPRNSTFSIDGELVHLRNGVSRVAAAPGSASVATTRYLGMAARGDLTRDGKQDVAYFISRDGAGSGTQYYVVAATQGKNGFRTTNPFFVGDRIKAESLRIVSNELHVNFVRREKGEPMTTAPSVPSVLLLKVTAQNVLEGLMK